MIKIRKNADGSLSFVNQPLEVKDSMGNIIRYWKEYDSNNNLIHYKDSTGYEYWKEYDSNNNEIHFRDLQGTEYWKEYDSNNNEIHYKDSSGYEYWKEYDSNNNEIHYKNSGGYEYCIVDGIEVSTSSIEIVA